MPVYLRNVTNIETALRLLFSIACNMVGRQNVYVVVKEPHNVSHCFENGTRACFLYGTSRVCLPMCVCMAGLLTLKCVTCVH